MIANKKWDALWVNGLIATCEQGYGLIKEAAIASLNGKIAWVGSVKDLKKPYEALAHQIYDVAGRCITPGFIDCHTHLIYAGNRANEFEMRLKGMSYEAISRIGCGIQSTVAATRSASEEILLNQALRHASALMASGVTTLEIKSGYGLDLVTELKILRVANSLENLLPITVYK